MTSETEQTSGTFVISNSGDHPIPFFYNGELITIVQPGTSFGYEVAENESITLG